MEHWFKLGQAHSSSKSVEGRHTLKLVFAISFVPPVVEPSSVGDSTTSPSASYMLARQVDYTGEESPSALTMDDTADGELESTGVGWELREVVAACDRRFASTIDHGEKGREVKFYRDANQLMQGQALQAENVSFLAQTEYQSREFLAARGDGYFRPATSYFHSSRPTFPHQRALISPIQLLPTMAKQNPTQPLPLHPH